MWVGGGDCKETLSIVKLSIMLNGRRLANYEKYPLFCYLLNGVSGRGGGEGGDTQNLNSNPLLTNITKFLVIVFLA
jgi:hypothetical protein